MSNDSTTNSHRQDRDDGRSGEANVPRVLAIVNRRGFVAAGSTMLLAAVVDACTSEGLRSQRGAVRLILTGLDPSATSGGTASLTKSRGGPTISVELPPIGEATVSVDIGDYSVRYEPPEGYVLASGDSIDSRSVSVDVDQMTTATFSVVAEATVGALEITVTGLLGLAGGTATLHRTDIAIPDRFIAIPASGIANNAGIPAGIYAITYAPPAGFTDASATNPVTGVIVTAGAVTPVTFAVAIAPGNLHIEVAGLIGAPSGGQVTAIQAGTGTSATLALGAPVTGRSTGDVADLPAGNYTVTYTPPAGYELTETSTPSRLVSVPAGGTANVIFDGRQIPGSVSVTVTGLSGAASGGQVRLALTGGGTFAINLPAPTGGSSSGTLTGLPPGNYSATYVPPVGYQLTSPSPVAVTVGSSGSSPVAFTTLAVDGTIRLVIDGLDPSAADGGTADVLRTDIPGQTPLSVAIPLSGSTDTSVQPGQYSVTYTPPTNHQVQTNQSNPRSVSVIGTQTAIAAFQVLVTPPDGILRVAVAGLLPSATTGGSVEILRTDITGQTPINQDIPVSGTLDTSLHPGAYRVRFTEPGGHQLAVGQQNPRTHAVTSSQTEIVPFQVIEIPPPVGIIFHSDFGTALGTSDAAVMDTGKGVPWDIRGGQGLEVIPSTGLDFPTANVLRVMALTSTSGFAALRQSGLPIPAVGQSRFYRWYIRAGANIEDANTHPIQDGTNAGASNWQFELLHTNPGGTRWTVQFKMGAVTQNFGNQNFRGPVLDANATYRFEIQVHRTSTSSYNFHVRVYDSTNPMTPRYTDADFVNIDTGATLASQGTGQFGFVDPANLDGLNAGCNGVGPLSSDRLYSYQSGFAISGTDWIGPYAGGF